VVGLLVMRLMSVLVMDRLVVLSVLTFVVALEVMVIGSVGSEGLVMTFVTVLAVINMLV